MAELISFNYSVERERNKIKKSPPFQFTHFRARTCASISCATFDTHILSTNLHSEKASARWAFGRGGEGLVSLGSTIRGQSPSVLPPERFFNDALLVISLIPYLTAYCVGM